MAWKGAVVGGLAGAPLGPWGVAGGAVLGSAVEKGFSAARERRDAQSEIYGAASGAQPQQLQYDPSWANLMKQRQNQLTSQQMDQSYRTQAGAAGDIWSQLAQRRGLSSGAAERGAQAATLQGVVGRQELGKQNTINNLGIDIKGEEMKRALEMKNYEEQMQAWAAAQGAKAQYAARPRGLFGGEGFLGLF